MWVKSDFPKVSLRKPFVVAGARWLCGLGLDVSSVESGYGS